MATLYNWTMTGGGLAEFSNHGIYDYDSTYDNSQSAQIIVPDVSGDVTSIQLRLYRVQSVGPANGVATITFRLGTQTGSILASSSIDRTTIPTSSGTSMEFVLNVTVPVVSGTAYCIVLTDTSGTEKVPISTSHDYVRWIGRGGVSPPIGHLAYHHYDGSGWLFQDGYILSGGLLGTSLPLKATNPTPAHEATGGDWSGLTLSWEDGGNTDSFDVFFGNTALFDEWVFLGNTTETSIVVPYTITGDNVTVEVQAYVGDPFDWMHTQIDWNVPLYWRVNSINDVGTTTGDIWWFDSRPGKTSVPKPTDAKTGITLDWADFSWTGGFNATSYDTYCSIETPPLTTLVNVVNSSAETSISQDDFIDAVFGKVSPYKSLAAYSSTYYWRVDSKNLFGVAEGDVWIFYTIALRPPGPAIWNPDELKWYIYDEEVYNPNFINTFRRLVAATKNSIYYEDI